MTSIFFTSTPFTFLRILEGHKIDVHNGIFIADAGGPRRRIAGLDASPERYRTALGMMCELCAMSAQVPFKFFWTRKRHRDSLW